MSSEVVNKSPTVAQRLFNQPFNCSIPDIYFYGEDIIKEVGMYSSGDSKMDMGQRQNLRDVYLTIVGMALHRYNGTPIRFKDPRCAVEIYHLITEHLNNWNKVLNIEFNVGKVPIEDLKILEDFAGEIYPLATQFTSQPLPEHERVDSFTNRSLNRLSNRLRTRAERVEQEEDPNRPSGTAPVVNKVTPHKPLMDALSRRYREHGGK